MQTLLRSGLVLVLGVLAARVSAEEMQWRPATSSAPAASGTGGITLQRPIPLATPNAPPQLQPTNFMPVVRGKADGLRPLPAGPVLNPDPTRKTDDTPREKIEVAPTPKPVLTPILEDLHGCDPTCCETIVCCECCGPCCDCCGICCMPRPRFWASAEYLTWEMHGQNVPPLVTGSPTGTPLASAGVLGQPTTTVLFDE